MIKVDPTQPWSLVVHGGAGNGFSPEVRDDVQAGLAAALAAGEAVLADGGSAEDACCAAVCVLEDTPVFNAGRGAALTASGTAELDACLMGGDGTAGAVAASRYARNPVLAARAVKEQTDHVLIADPSRDWLLGSGLDVVDPDYFETPRRLGQLAELQARLETGPRHGTVGAVARDATGHLAAATSTGGVINQAVGRVGDTPIVGAGTFAADGVVAVSCTGEGEAFMLGVVAHDVAARMAYLELDAADAVHQAIETGVGGRDAIGGIIAVDASGRVVVDHNSPAMAAAWRDDDGVQTKL